MSQPLPESPSQNDDESQSQRPVPEGLDQVDLNQFFDAVVDWEQPASDEENSDAAVLEFSDPDDDTEQAIPVSQPLSQPLTRNEDISKLRY